jgi:hypothetical protein
MKPSLEKEGFAEQPDSPKLAGCEGVEFLYMKLYMNDYNINVQ